MIGAYFLNLNLRAINGVYNPKLIELRFEKVIYNFGQEDFRPKETSFPYDGSTGSFIAFIKKRLFMAGIEKEEFKHQLKFGYGLYTFRTRGVAGMIAIYQSNKKYEAD